jgi:arachidonate 15-lipoxygenase
MTPTLPADDPNREARDRALAEARSRYRYDRSYQDVVLSESVAPGEGFDPGYIAMAAGLEARFLANRTALGFSLPNDEDGDGRTDLGERLRLVGAAARRKLPAHRVGGVAEFEALYPKLGLPDSARHWRKDWYFAWQRLAGGYPVALERMGERRDSLPLTDEVLRRATFDGDSVDRAIEEGRLYLCDYRDCDGLPCGVTEGYQKYLWAPLAVFAVKPGARGPRDGFVPVAIQCDQRPGPDNPLWTPQHGTAWEMAKCVVQTADAHYREIGAHTGLCHLVMEAVLLATHRELAPNHPIMVLLAPHFDQTQATNDVMRKSFIGPDGIMERSQSPTLEGAFTLIERRMSTFALSESALEADLAARGVGDAASLPWYPYRDDARLVVAATRRWVEGYLSVYYPTDEHVRRDTELADWLRALGAADAAGLRGVPAVGDRATLCELVTLLVWQATAYHSVINYTGWEFLGWHPNQPTAAYGRGPTPAGPNTEQELNAMWPPLDTAVQVQEVMYQLGHSRYNRLGEYGRSYFADERVRDPLLRFQGALGSASEQVKAANAARPLPFVYLDPATIPASIHV